MPRHLLVLQPPGGLWLPTVRPITSATSIPPSSRSSIRCNDSSHFLQCSPSQNCAKTMTPHARTLVTFSSKFGSRRANFGWRRRVCCNFSTTGSGNNDGGGDKDQARQDHAHCVDLVRSRDMEGYLCGLLMPANSRPSYFAVRAFNVELASIKDGGGIPRRSRRNETTVGIEDASLASRLRMQWWRDAVAELYGGMEEENFDGSVAHFMASAYGASRKHNPVVRALKKAVEEKELTRRFLDRMVDAREGDLDVEQYGTLDDVVRYGEETAGSFLYLSLECAGIRDEHADTVASHVGVGTGLITALRSTAYRATNGELSVPTDLMDKHGAQGHYLLSGGFRRFSNEDADVTEPDREADESLREAVREMAIVASAHLAKAREMQSGVQRGGRPSLLPAVGALQYLEKLEEVEFDVFHPKLTLLSEGRGRLGHMFLLGRAWMTGIF